MRKVVLGLFLFFLPVIAWALALGPIKTNSYLDQPFNAEIPLQSLGQTNMDNITVKLAPPETYAGTGIKMGPYSSDLQFKVQYSAVGKPIIRVYTQKPLNDPFLEFIILVSWPNGLLTHQYTVLLDPVELAKPAASSTSVSAAPVKQVIAANTVPVAPGTNAGSYGPTTPHDTVSSIANAIRPDQSISLDQVEYALYKANPDAFINNDINRMKTGYTLQIPTINQMKAIVPQAATAQLQQLGRLPSPQVNASITNAQSTQGGPPPTSMTRPDLSSYATPIPPGQMPNQGQIPQQQVNVPPPIHLGNGQQSVDTTTTLPAQTSNATPPPGAGTPADVGSLQAELAVASQAVDATKRANEIMSYQMLQIQKQNQQLQQIITNQQQQINELRTEMAELHGDKSTGTKAHATSAPTSPAQHPSVAPKQLPASSLQPLQSDHHQLLDFLVLMLVLWLIAIAVLFYLRWKRLHQIMARGQVVATTSTQVNASATFIQPKATAATPTVLTEANVPTSTSVQQQQPAVPVGATPNLAPAPTEPLLTPKPEFKYTPTHMVQDAVSVPVVTDPLEEAEVYMAYERYRPAESVLMTALSKDPNRPELLDKLFELYTLIPDQVAYRKAMQEYRERIQSIDPELWERVVERHEEKWPTQIPKKPPTATATPIPTPAPTPAPSPVVATPPVAPTSIPTVAPITMPVQEAPPVVVAPVASTPSVTPTPTTSPTPTPKAEPSLSQSLSFKLAPRDEEHHEPLSSKAVAQPDTPATPTSPITPATPAPATPVAPAVVKKVVPSSVIDMELDLVETYIGMGDFAAAEESLQGVIDKCDPKQRERADILLEKLKSAF